MMKLGHVTIEQHKQAKELVARIQNDLGTLARIANRAPYTDRVMRVQKAVQERLIDPLADQLSPPESYQISYPSTCYHVR